MKRQVFWWCAALALAALSPSCGPGETGSEKVCEPGTEVFCRPCAGNPDEPGTKACNAEGSGFAECVPKSGACPVFDCTPGETRFCECDGAAGEQICNDDGTGYTACECSGEITCAPGETLFCTCDGESGQKTCNDEGTKYSACDCSGSGGAGGGGGGSGGGNPGSKPLLSPCLQDDECETNQCPMGYCTKDCGKVSDCPFGASECVPLGAKAICMPTCTDQSNCNVYLRPSECGYTKAIDDFPVTTCADWLSDLELPPDGSACADDADCNLGHEGKERVCTFEACTTGCYEDKDCPLPQTCSSSGSTIGNCE